LRARDSVPVCRGEQPFSDGDKTETSISKNRIQWNFFVSLFLRTVHHPNTLVTQHFNTLHTPKQTKEKQRAFRVFIEPSPPPLSCPYVITSRAVTSPYNIYYRKRLQRTYEYFFLYVSLQRDGSSTAVVLLHLYVP